MSIERIEHLIETLPYIEGFRGKTFLVKYGGSIMHSEKEKASFVEDVALMMQLGIKVIIVHGGGQFISKRLADVDIESSFQEGYRVTDEKAIKEVEMLLSGGINTELTLRFNNRGVRAVGVNGKDAGLIKASKKLIVNDDKVIDIGHVGHIQSIDITYLNLLIDRGYLPIVSPIGFDQLGTTYNLNADDVAGQLSGALQAEKLILMTDVKGLYEVFGREETFIDQLDLAGAKKLIKEGAIQGGMIPKVKSCVTSLEGGTKSAHIINGMTPHSLLLEVFTNSGVGTMVEEGESI